jgi:hypothetical protein
MKCAVNRWGPGTTCERPTNTQNAKDLQDKLAKIRSERTEQDKMWESEPVTATHQTTQIQVISQTNKKYLHARDNILYSS